MSPLRLLPLLLLAGCSWFSSPEPERESRPEYLACRREARDKPEVRTLAAQVNTANPANAVRLDPERRQLENRFYRECLRRQGLALPGGVESVRQR
jgi:hypothetical protein